MSYFNLPDTKEGLVIDILVCQREEWRISAELEVFKLQATRKISKLEDDKRAFRAHRKRCGAHQLAKELEIPRKTE